jgi:hypothetical protein
LPELAIVVERTLLRGALSVSVNALIADPPIRFSSIPWDRST